MTDFDLVGELECVWEVRAICGEGPLWIEAEQPQDYSEIIWYEFYKTSQQDVGKDTHSYSRVKR